MSSRHLLAAFSIASFALAACGTRGEQRAARTEKVPPSMVAASAGPKPAHTEIAVFGMGCFWGAEEHFHGRPGVIATSVGYAGGHTADPSYEKVSAHTTGHAEVVRVEFDPTRISYDELLRIFWEQHDPTQGDRQGNDIGDSYRSAIYAYGPAQLAAAKASQDAYQRALTARRFPTITTEIRSAPEFYPAEPFHQQYCIRNPEGYCGHGGTGVDYPMSAALR